MRFGILGRGFGLYGYLPALVRDGHEIILPERYRATLGARSDLSSYVPSVTFVDNEAVMYETIDALVLAVRPEDQAAQLTAILKSPRLRFLMLEKPVAPTPALSNDMLARLEASAIRFRIGYTFAYTKWARQFDPQPGEPAPWRINWHFMAHHYAHGLSIWKRYPASGGGALRFFGIHLLALLAARGYSEVISAETDMDGAECASFFAEFAGNNLPSCSVEVVSRAAAPLFRVSQQVKENWVDRVTLVDPSGAEPSIAMADTRVGLLMSVLRELVDVQVMQATHYRLTNKLWAGVETAVL